MALPGGTDSRADELRHPDLVEGELSNGLDYAILPAEGRDGVSFRLVVFVGSQAESDDNRGVAHFVEHMAFRSSDHFADGEAEQVMAAAGAAFGRDHNAYTSRWTTSYHLDLPAADPVAMARGLAWLRDVADGLSFRADEVATERGVVLAELRDSLRSGDAADEQETSFHFQPEDTHDPGGEVASLNALTPADLRAFHAKWYRPDRALIVVTGAVDATAMAAELERRMGGWAGAGKRPRIPAGPEPEPPETPTALVLAPVRLPAASMACRNTARSSDQEADPASELRRDVLLKILNTRLDRAAAASPGVYGLWLNEPSGYETRQVTCVQAAHGSGQGLEALTLAQATLRGFAAEGPERSEIDQAIALQRAMARGALTERANATAAELADELVYSLAYGAPFLHPHQMMRQISLGASALTGESLVADLASIWPEALPPTLSVEEAGVSPAAVLARWQAGQAARLAAAFPPPTPLSFDFGPPGQVVRRETLSPGVARITFANGLVLKHMATDHAPGLVELRVRLGPSARTAAAADFVAAGVAASVLPTAGAGGRGYSALSELSADWDWDFDADLTDGGLVISARSFASQVSQHMDMILAHLTAPSFDAEVDDRLLFAAASLEQDGRLDPLQASKNAFARTIWPDTMGAVGDPATYRRLTAGRLREALAPFLFTGPVELTLVGDISEADAVDLAARTLGARPPRPPATPTAERPPLNYSAAPAGPIEVIHQGPAERAVAQIYWARSPVRAPKEQAAALALTSLLELAVTEETRRRQGRTYSPVADLDGGLNSPDDIALYVEVTPSAKHLDEVTDAVLQAAEGLVTIPLSPETLDLVRRPLVTEANALRGSDAYWAGVLADDDWASKRTELDRLAASLEALTPADIQALAKTWLTQRPIIVLARPAGQPTGVVK